MITMPSSDFSQSDEYLSFRSSVPLKIIVVDSFASQGWKVYDVGPKSVKTPVICLPPISGTADVFYKQLMGLSAKGYRIIAAENPPYWNVEQWCEGFRKLMDSMGFVKAHIFGASLGGFLAQKFAEYTFRCQRVASLVLCNSYTDTSRFRIADIGNLYRSYPAILLKKMILSDFPRKLLEKEMSDSIDFMVEKLENLSQKDLSSRLSIIQDGSCVDPSNLRALPITISDVFDDYAVSISNTDPMYTFYPHAKLAHLKSGGNFPYLSRSDEINMHLQVAHTTRMTVCTFSCLLAAVKGETSGMSSSNRIHLRPFLDTPLSARE